MSRPFQLRRRVAQIIAIAAVAAAGSASSQEAERIALVAALEGPIGPASARHVEVAVKAARERNAEVLVLRLNTPGGLATSMRDIITHILGAAVPVVGYVAPPGAHAASAGTYILYATHVAAMAPGTNLGAATPVQIGGGGFPGQPPPEVGDDKGKDGPAETDRPTGTAMEAKAVNDAVAFIRSLAELHGRDADWAETAVREAATLSAQQALERNVINVVADDILALLAAIDGRSVIAGSRQRTLATKGLAVETIEPSLVTQALAVLANPNVAFILLMIGVYGLIFELSNPGAIGPGVLGVICLVLGLYALNQLPLSYAGLALIALGIAFMVGEAVTPTLGVLGVGGLAAFVIGAAMLMDADVPAFRLSPWVIAGTAALSAGFLIFVLGYAWQAQRLKPVSGLAGLIGAEGRVVDWAGGEGHVWAAGERWQARGGEDLTPDAVVRIRAIKGLTLEVAAESGAGAAQERRDQGTET